VDGLVVTSEGERYFEKFGTLLQHEPERQWLREEIDRVVSLPFPRGVECAEHEIATASRRYRVRRIRLGPGVFMVGAALVASIDGLPSDLPSMASLQAEFGLTRRESEVALLLARRLTTAEIARAIGTSDHTARHHVERVRSKLGVSRRSEVARLLKGVATRK
jgi:DNA-binding CsgD family transcriptional regulator